MLEQPFSVAERKEKASALPGGRYERRGQKKWHNRVRYRGSLMLNYRALK